MYRAVLIASTLVCTAAMGLLSGSVFAQHLPAGTSSMRWSSPFPALDGDVMALAAHGDTLYMGGFFVTAGGDTVNRVAMWDGQHLSNLGSGVNGAVQALAVDGRGTLYAGGSFTDAGGRPVGYVAGWNGTSWEPLGGGLNSTVYALAAGPDGTLYAGGSFTRAGDSEARYIAMWRGGRWQALGSGMDHNVMALKPTSDGRLYAAGGFTMAGGKTAHQVARWNGTEWEALGGGIHPPFDARPVWVLALDPRGGLYAGGNFDAAGDMSSPFLSRWDGRRWSPMGEGVDGGVHAMALGADGSLYIGGYFTRAGNVSARHLARWKDGQWFALEGGADNLVHALALGQGDMLHVGGSFQTVDDVISANGLACWQMTVSTGAEHADIPDIPQPYEPLVWVYPNPFATFTRISFVADGVHSVTLKVFDALGRERLTLRDGVPSPGRHEMVLDASRLPSGTYQYVLDTGSAVHAGSAVVLRP